MSTVVKTASKINNSLKLKLRPSQERGSADHGWLKTFHTFSFASYHDPFYQSYGPLRVINEDRVQEGEGFGTHPHREFEIFSYIVSGELEHRDSMGNVEIMKRGDLQMTSAGTGIRHSEYNRNTKMPVHFLQIWALPNKSGLPPKYYTRETSDEEKLDKLAHVVGPVASEGVTEVRESKGAAPVHADLHLFATLLQPGSTVTHTFKEPIPGSDASPRKGYLHVIQKSGFNTKKATGATVKVNGEETLAEGDGVFIAGGVPGESFEITNTGDKEAEFLLFDMGA